MNVGSEEEAVVRTLVAVTGHDRCGGWTYANRTLRCHCGERWQWAPLLPREVRNGE